MDKNLIDNFLKLYHKNKNIRIKSKITVELKPLVQMISKKFLYLGETFNDLQQIGTIGLLKAIDAYRAKKGHHDFFAYATKKIIGEIKHYFRDTFKIIKVPRKYLKTYYDMNKFIQAYLQKHKGRSPTIQEIAKAIKTSTETILETMEIMHICSMINLEKPLFKSTGEETTFASNKKEYLSNEPNQTFEEKIDNLIFLSKVMQNLSFREKKMLQLYYGDNLTQNEIAKRFKVSQVCVFRIINKALEKCQVFAKERTKN